MFGHCKQFNCDLSRWNVSNVINMRDMFDECECLECDLSKWYTSKVKDMTCMFTGCNRLTIPDWYKK